MPSDLLHDLRSILPPDRIITDPSELYVYESDGFTIAKAVPRAVLFPTSTAEVVRIVQALAKHDAQIVPRGSGTGLTGGCTAYDNGVIVSTVRMNRILKIDLANRVAHVEAGVRNVALSEEIAREGSGSRVQGSGDATPDTRHSSLDTPSPFDIRHSTFDIAPYHFAPDPSSQRASTIGGNAATNAGGIHTLKDFVTSNHVLGLEMVLGDGSVVQVGAREGCYESGPFDLPGLICGHEGTFGIITRLWVRLVPRATAFRTMMALFPSRDDACQAVSDVIATGLLPSAMEMFDGRMVRLVEEMYRFGFPKEAEALILTEIDGIDALLDGQIAQIADICSRHGAMSIQVSSDAATRAKLWKARKSAFGALGKITPSYCTQDACVPRSRLAEVLRTVDEIGREHGLVINNIFHAGDGNVHPVFLYDDRDEAQVQNVLAAAEKVLKYCIDIGGTLTGEHGVGVEKIHLVPYQFDGPTLAQMMRVKRAFDPDERINAGKRIPSETVSIRLLKPGRRVPQ